LATESIKVFYFYWLRHTCLWGQRALPGIGTEKIKRMPDFRHPRPTVISFFLCRCPRCGKDKVFPRSILNITKFAETQYSCNHCKLNYEPEPGFFFGAMYWSYALIVAFIVILSITFSLMGLFDYAIVAIPVGILLFLPVIFRYSRMLMLYVVYPMMYKDKFFGKGNQTGK
jgi:uncharacterized protein (DUF983 family)